MFELAPKPTPFDPNPFLGEALLSASNILETASRSSSHFMVNSLIIIEMYSSFAGLLFLLYSGKSASLPYVRIKSICL